ncbi:MAG: hypothetical protein QOJ92_876 [Frankiales bacterium]|nr:hypothetical protein [Frankiales bacterium]
MRTLTLNHEALSDAVRALAPCLEDLRTVVELGLEVDHPWTREVAQEAEQALGALATAMPALTVRRPLVEVVA